MERKTNQERKEERKTGWKKQKRIGREKRKELREEKKIEIQKGMSKKIAGKKIKINGKEKMKEN